MGPAPAALSLAGLPQRIRRRITELGPTDVSAYRADLEFHPREWAAFDAFCRIPIARFARDRDVFEHLRQVMLPAAAQRALDRRDDALRCWSAGCASGEAAYTLRIPWDLDLAPRSPGLPLRIVATDVDESLLERARRACYDGKQLEGPPSGRGGTGLHPLG